MQFAKFVGKMTALHYLIWLPITPPKAAPPKVAPVDSPITCPATPPIAALYSLSICVKLRIH